ncbi:hypothetical protein XELAEV_18003950mg [Xenopus laevis]|uniref:Uncharacterized protein n=1 Tax=Xenopus laevis TaxID=8355 RepID=A0A974BQ12_XENLA|nr:hypothetical protein XELAEV_18003950mg [Xenopus laevis]
MYIVCTHCNCEYGMMDAYSFALCYRTSAEEVENPVQDAVETEEDTCEEEMDIEHPFLMLSTSASKMSTKKIMEEAGLHRKHTTNSPLLQGFRSYLEKKYAKSGIKHEVDNVSRWLHFVNPNEPSTSCIHNIERSMEFFRVIGASAASRATARNYMSGVKKFIAYVTSEDQLLEEDPSLRGSIQNFLKSMTEAQKSICRGASKKNSVGRRCTNPRECQEVLKLANHYFAELIDRANARNELEERDMTSVLFYLEALLILQHLQRPSVIQHMTVQQWLERKQYKSRSTDSARAAVITVKAGAQHMVVLNEVEEMWFDTYFRFIRLTFIKRIANGDKGYFFVSSKGSKIQNPTTDVHRFQERFNACLSTGKEALHFFEKVVTCESSLEDQELIKIYLRADFKGIESNHTQYMRAAMRVSELQRTWEEPSNSRDGQVPGTLKEKMSEKEISYKKIENMFKVELDSKGPTVKQCCEVSEMHAKYCYDRWRRQQIKCRMDAVIAHYKHEKPNLSQVYNYLRLKGWVKNVPSVEEILLHWEAREQPRREDNDG